jgi:RNA polymerase sigma-70 factor (ECF subfamily)
LSIDELIELVQLHGHSIYRFCYKLMRSKEDADDLYQETFLKAMELRHKIDMSNNPKAFLISIVIRLHKNHRRKLAWRQRIAPTTKLDEDITALSRVSTTEATPEAAILSLERHSMVQDAVRQLNDRLKLPLYMYYTAEMTVEEISLALNIPSGTVKSRLHKARKIMKTMLEVDAH